VKIFKRIILVLLVVLVLAQIPFIYRRYETGKLAERIAQLDAQRTTYADPNFKEYKGIIHAHTNLGGHSTGSFDELIAAANANDLDFVLMTEHYSDTYDTAAQTLNGVYGKTLFVGGNEIDTSDGDRFLLIPGGGEASKARMSGTTEFLEKAHSENKLALITYPEKFKSWDSKFDGIEAFSLHTQAKQMSWLGVLGDLIWSYHSYPELTLAKNFTRSDANLAKFDEIAAERQISLFAGTDAHSNIGFHIFGDDAGNKLINFKLDPYETIFRIARIHVLIEKDKEFNRDTLLEAIRSGRYWIGFDALGDTTGFRFQLGEASIGGIVPWTEYPQLILNVPPRTNVPEYTLGVPSEMSVRVYRNGEIFPIDIVAAIYSKQSFKPGVYRVEVYRDDLGPPFDKIPWIMSNPIFVK
jgi:histidinol phosphatase-like PHP family hydrolase